MRRFRGIFFQLYWHSEDWLPQYMDLRGEPTRRVFVHRDRYIVMHDYTLLIPERGQIAHYAELGMVIVHDDRGVQIGFEEVGDE